MRERAEGATPGPWRPDPGNNVSGNVRADGRLVIDGGGYPGDGTAKPVVFGAALTADAVYIASMHPLVGLALTDWLESRAVQYDAYASGPSGEDMVTFFASGGRAGYLDPALRVARAILGTGEAGQ
jgi:hypothetical protein